MVTWLGGFMLVQLKAFGALERGGSALGHDVGVNGDPVNVFGGFTINLLDDIHDQSS